MHSEWVFHIFRYKNAFNQVNRKIILEKLWVVEAIIGEIVRVEQFRSLLFMYFHKSSINFFITLTLPVDTGYFMGADVEIRKNQATTKAIGPQL